METPSGHISPETARQTLAEQLRQWGQKLKPNMTVMSLGSFHFTAVHLAEEVEKGTPLGMQLLDVFQEADTSRETQSPASPDTALTPREIIAKKMKEMQPILDVLTGKNPDPKAQRIIEEWGNQDPAIIFADRAALRASITALRCYLPTLQPTAANSSPATPKSSI
jgi:hypothetical protein